MKKAKSFLSLALGAALILSAFTACGNGTPSSSSDTASESSVAASSTSSESTASSEAPVALSGEVVKFQLAATRQDAQPPVKDVAIIKDMVASSNVEIDWLDWPQSAVEEKMSLAFASNAYPDAIMGAWVVTPMQVADYSSQGILLPLDEYITPEVMPNLAEKFEKRPQWKNELVSADGSIYALGSIEERGLRLINDTLLINTEWLEKVGKEMPTTLDEMYDVLKAFKEAGDLNGNGEDDEIPMILHYANHMRGTHSVPEGSFGLSGSGSGDGSYDSLSVKDGKVVFFTAQPEYKESIKFLHKLYQEKLIDPELFTVTAATYVAKANAVDPISGMMVNWGRRDPNSAVGREVYDYVPPLTSSPDVKPMWQARDMPISGNLGFIMTNKAQDPAGIMNFIDKFYDTDTSIQNFFGVVGKHIEKHDDTTYSWILNAEGNQPTYEERYDDVQTNRGLWMVLEDDFQWKEENEEQKENKIAESIYGPYIDPNPYPVCWLTVEEANEITILQYDLREYVKANAAKWIAEGGIDEEWDNYLKQLENLSVDRYIEIRQAAYDRTIASK